MYAISPVNIDKSRILAQFKQIIDHHSSRSRAVVAFGLVSMLAVVAAFAVAPATDNNKLQLQTIVEQLAAPNTKTLQTEQMIFMREERVQRGDTLATLLTRLGVQERAAFEFMRTNSIALSITRQLKPGKAFTAKTLENGDLLALYAPSENKNALITVIRNGDEFIAKEQNLTLETRTVLRSGEIRQTLFGATDAADIPDAIAVQLAEIFSADIDFHRDLRKGDRFSLVYEMFYLDGQAIRSGRILAAEFTNNQKNYQAFWHTNESNKTGAYYSANGKTLRKAFLRSPLEFSRITSGFSSSRFHPVLQTWRAHKGVDYGAPSGTRVRAVADGVVEFAGRQGGYGNLLVIRHQGAYSTAYGHLKQFAPGIRKGTRVGQGDLIGFVGQTGLASGPHLHYEFRIRDQQVNPLALNLPTSMPLETKQMARFKTEIAPWAAQLSLAQHARLLALD